MLRKILIFGLLLAAVGGALAAWRLSRPPRPKTEVSYLVIVVDSLRADHVAAYGHAHGTTPRIDALAADGIVFEHPLAQAPWTKPSVASLFTSTYSGVHRVRRARRFVNGEAVSDTLSGKFLTLAEALGSAGLATGGFGMKLHLRPQFGFDQGFDAYDMEAGDAAAINETLLDWLREEDPDRFFVYLHYNDPHYPYQPERRHATFGATEARVQITGDTKRAFRAGELELTEEDGRQLAALYDGEIHYNDRHIGELLEALGRQGYERVLVILTADHGEEFLEHGDITHGHSLYQELLRVPFLVGGTGLPESARGRRVRDTVQLVDVMPTLLELEDLPFPPDVQGTSLVPVLAGAERVAARPYSFGERLFDPERPAADTIFDGRFKLIRDPEHGATVLFDLEADPGERNPLDGDAGEAGAALEARLDAWAETNLRVWERIRPDQATPLDEATQEKLRSLGYIN